MAYFVKDDILHTLEPGLLGRAEHHDLQAGRHSHKDPAVLDVVAIVPCENAMDKLALKAAVAVAEILVHLQVMVNGYVDTWQACRFPGNSSPDACCLD